MNAAIELHDSELAAITREDDAVILTFSPAYVHRSLNRAGTDAGSGWTQTITFAFADASVVSPVQLPSELRGGWLRIGSHHHENILPAEGVFEDCCELWLQLAESNPFSIHGTRLVVTAHGQPRYIEEFPS